MKAKWNKITRPPKIGGEYNVVWVLGNNIYPVVTTMDYDAKKKKWVDVIGNTKSNKIRELLYWAELPKPPKNIPKKLWYNEK